MLPVIGLFEAHLTVRDFDRALAFYRNLLGFELGFLQPERPAAFFWIGGRGRCMMGIFGADATDISKSHHIAFQVDLQDVLAASGKLRAAGVTPMGGRKEPINEPVVFPWMPAASVFFEDPDGNVLEYIAMLPDSPRPDPGPVTWSNWRAEHEISE